MKTTYIWLFVAEEGFSLQGPAYRTLEAAQAVVAIPKYYEWEEDNRDGGYYMDLVWRRHGGYHVETSIQRIELL